MEKNLRSGGPCGVWCSAADSCTGLKGDFDVVDVPDSGCVVNLSSCSALCNTSSSKVLGRLKTETSLSCNDSSPSFWKSIRFLLRSRAKSQLLFVLFPVGASPDNRGHIKRGQSLSIVCLYLTIELVVGAINVSNTTVTNWL